jgi:hypothetical protein
MAQEAQFNYKFLIVTITYNFKGNLLDKNQLWGPKEGDHWTRAQGHF